MEGSRGMGAGIVIAAAGDGGRRLAAEPAHPGFQALSRLLKNDSRYLKLAAPYETSKSGPPFYADVGRYAKALVPSIPDRVLWASNWPHPSSGFVGPDDADMLDLLLDWVSDETTRRKVLVDNPARLYGF